MTRINFTGRRRITRSRIHLHLASDDDGIRLDVRRIDLGGLNLPDDALVAVEAYHQTTYARVSCGRVGALDLARDVALPQFSAPETILFRVKVIGTGPDDGRLLAAADRLPATAIEGSGGRRPLLPFRAEPDMGMLWRLDFAMDQPTVVIDAGIGDWHEFARQPYFVSLVYPEILRQVALWVFDRQEEAAEGESVESYWIQFLKRYGPAPAEVAEDGQSAWAEDLAAAFARDKNLVATMAGLVGLQP
jgi:hypothetical protein